MNPFINSICKQQISYNESNFNAFYSKCLRYNLFGGKNSRAKLLLTTYWLSQIDSVEREKKLESAMKLAVYVEIVLLLDITF